MMFGENSCSTLKAGLDAIGRQEIWVRSKDRRHNSGVRLRQWSTFRRAEDSGSDLAVHELFERLVPLNSSARVQHSHEAA
jgi:hypothetical protein